MVERENILPLVLRTSEIIVGVCFTSKKTAEKTLEQGVLWIIHPDTGKEVMYTPEVSILEVHMHDHFCIAEVDEKIHYAENTWEALNMGSLHNLGSNRRKEKQIARKISSNYADLALLEEVIKDRKEKLPEGSYTTHLFEKGKDKIRKKVGEEAVEVLMSKNPEELVSESADLVYHLFVMLINEGLSPQKIVQELLERHTH